MKKQQDTPMEFSPVNGDTINKITAHEYRRARPNAIWRFNPWTGNYRLPADVESDPKGLLILPPGEQVIAAHPEPYTDISPADKPVAMPSVACEVGGITEPHYLTLTYLCEVPAGAHLMAFRNRVFVVAPGMAPQYVTPTGLTPVQVAEGPAQG